MDLTNDTEKHPCEKNYLNIQTNSKNFKGAKDPIKNSLEY